MFSPNTLLHSVNYLKLADSLTFENAREERDLVKFDNLKSLGARRV